MSKLATFCCIRQINHTHKKCVCNTNAVRITSFVTPAQHCGSNCAVTNFKATTIIYQMFSPSSACENATASAGLKGATSSSFLLIDVRGSGINDG